MRTSAMFLHLLGFTTYGAVVGATSACVYAALANSIGDLPPLITWSAIFIALAFALAFIANIFLKRSFDLGNAVVTGLSAGVLFSLPMSAGTWIVASLTNNAIDGWSRFVWFVSLSIATSVGATVVYFRTAAMLQRGRP